MRPKRLEKVQVSYQPTKLPHSFSPLSPGPYHPTCPIAALDWGRDSLLCQRLAILPEARPPSGEEIPFLWNICVHCD